MPVKFSFNWFVADATRAVGQEEMGIQMQGLLNAVVQMGAGVEMEDAVAGMAEELVGARVEEMTQGTTEEMAMEMAEGGDGDGYDVSMLFDLVHKECKLISIIF